jgi:hypothetical protein
MSISRRTLTLVQRALPSLCLCNSILVIPPTQRILRAFEFERTPYKGQFYLWRVVMPLYRPTEGVLLNYSDRLARGELLQLSKDDPAEAVAAVTKLISDDLPALAKIRDPIDFFHHISWMIGNDMPSVLLDLALTYYKIDRLAEMRETVDRLIVKLDEFYAWQISGRIPKTQRSRRQRAWERQQRALQHTRERLRIAEDLSAALKSDPSVIAKMTEAWERRNIEQFNLARTMHSSASVPAEQ